MALDRVACRREGAQQVLVLDAARGDRLRAHGRTRQAQVAHRARLSGTQAGTRAWALRGPRLARFPPPCQLVPCSLWLPDRRAGEDLPLRICRPEAQSDWPSHGLSTPRRLPSDRSGTSRTQSPPCAGGSPWPWPKASSDVRAAQPTSAGLRTISARDAVVLKAHQAVSIISILRFFPLRTAWL